MDVKMNVKKRRQERIRQLTVGELAKGQAYIGGVGLSSTRREEGSFEVKREEAQSPSDRFQEELDPEVLWKRGQGRWNESGYRMDGHSDDPGRRRSSFWTRLFIRTAISAVVFIAIWGMNRFEPEWAFPIRAFVAESLTKEMDFGAVEAWYEETFGGAPSFIPIFKHTGEKGVKVGSVHGFVAPIEGMLAGPFALSLKGVEIIPLTDSIEGDPVKVVETGRIVSVNEDALTGLTVKVEHAEGYESIYGRLGRTLVSKGDWVEAGDTLGILTIPMDAVHPTLYFALKKNDRYVDPTDVIPFD